MLISANCYAIIWEKISTNAWDSFNLQRAAIPNGWILRSSVYGGWNVIFVPDENHSWKL